MKNLTLNKTAFEMVQLLVPHVDINRPQLKGVYLYDEGTTRNYVCTNGHMLIEVQAPVEGNPIDEPFLIEMEKELNLKKYRFGDMEALVVSDFNSDDYGKMSLLDKVYNVTKDNGYPADYRKIIPNENTKKADFYTMFGSEYVAILKRLGDLHCVIPQMEAIDKCAMWKKELGNGLKLTVCLMSVRVK